MPIGTHELSKRLNCDHRLLKRNIAAYMDDIAAFGAVDERKSTGPGRPIQEYILNDEQAMMLVLLLPTNKTTARAKADAVKIFAESRRLLFKEASQ